MPDFLDAALRFTLKWEGGYVNDPDDPGGATNMGVTQSVYDAWRKARRLPVQSVRNISRAEAVEIYRERYWIASRAAFLRWPLCLAVFDTAVNFGVGRSNEFVSKALGIEASLKWNPKASELIHKADPKALALKIASLRMDYRRERVRQSPKMQKFLKGWLNRDNALKKEIETA